MSTYKNLLAALAVGVVACHAQATTQAQVTVSSLSYQLKDLNPADGVDAAFGFGAALGSAVLITQREDQDGWSAASSDGTIFLDPRFRSPIDGHGYIYLYGRSGDLSSSWASASVQQTPSSFGQLAMQLSAIAGQTANAQASYSREFVLGADTQVTFTVLVSGSFSGPASTAVLPSDQFISSPHSSVYWRGFIGVGSLESSLDQSGANFFDGHTDSYEQSLDGQVLKLTVKNTGSTSKTYELRLGTLLTATELAAPVPEPATYAMMALGLLGVGAAVRRQCRS